MQEKYTASHILQLNPFLRDIVETEIKYGGVHNLEMLTTPNITCEYLLIQLKECFVEHKKTMISKHE